MSRGAAHIVAVHCSAARDSLTVLVGEASPCQVEGTRVHPGGTPLGETEELLAEDPRVPRRYTLSWLGL